MTLEEDDKHFGRFLAGALLTMAIGMVVLVLTTIVVFPKFVAFLVALFVGPYIVGTLLDVLGVI